MKVSGAEWFASIRKNNFSNSICVSFGIRRAFMCKTLLRNTTRGSHSGCNYVRAKSFQQSQLLLLAKILSSSSCQKGVLATFLLIIYCVEEIEAKTLWALAIDGTKKMPILALHYAPETFKMWSWSLTLLKFDHFTATQIVREIKFWQIQTVQKCCFWFQRFWLDF